MARERRTVSYGASKIKVIVFVHFNLSVRSELRIQQGREQPVDYLVKILLIQRGKFDYDPNQEREIRKPYTLLTRLTREELIQLHQDIQVRKFVTSKVKFYRKKSNWN